MATGNWTGTSLDRCRGSMDWQASRAFRDLQPASFNCASLTKFALRARYLSEVKITGI